VKNQSNESPLSLVVATKNGTRTRIEASDLPSANHREPSPSFLIDAKILAQLLSVSEATIWRWDSGGRLPQAVKPSPGVKRWRREEIREWIDVGCPCRKDWEAVKKANK